MLGQKLVDPGLFNAQNKSNLLKVSLLMKMTVDQMKQGSLEEIFTDPS